MTCFSSLKNIFYPLPLAPSLREGELIITIRKIIPSPSRGGLGRGNQITPPEIKKGRPARPGLSSLLICLPGSLLTYRLTD